MVLKEFAKAAGSQPAGPGEAPRGVAHGDAEYAPGGATHGVARGTPEEHQRAWPLASEAHHREPGTDTWRCALTTSCVKRVRVLFVVVSASYCPHDLHHVPRRGDGGRHSPAHPRSAREGEDQGVTTMVERSDMAE